MAGAIIENLSGRKLGILIVFLMLCQVVCFLVGALIAPAPSSAMSVLGTKCIDKKYSKDKWYYPRGEKRCRSISSLDEPVVEQDNIEANDIIFAFQIPSPKDNFALDYSRWQQNLLSVMHLDIYYDDDAKFDPNAVMTIEARLGYRNKGDPDTKWTEYASSVEERTLDCYIEPRHMRAEYIYNCSSVPMFELGSLHHDFYLLNIRLPMDTAKESWGVNTNDNLGRLTDMWVVFIHQNGGFTKVWVSLKTIFFPTMVAIMAWFWRRISLLTRPPALLEYMLMVLGAALTFLNCPLEYLTLVYDCPWMTVVSDIRQGLFYASLLSFWLIFTGEHLMDDIERNRIRVYWRHLSAVLGGCLCLFIFDMCERGVQLRNPFYSIWVTPIGTNLALAFIMLAGICAGLYFCFLSYMIWKVFINISSKRQSLPAMSSARRLHYEGIIYRFKVLMLATLLCAAMTVIGFILGQVSEGQWSWDDNIKLEYTSAFFTGVYGMWNIYTFALICLYAPSHKRWPKDQDWAVSDNCGLASIHGALLARDTQSSTGEEIEFSRLATEPSEMSSITAFAKKTAAD
ncbi:protein wntless-like isoform X2 [Portunus trituberculatus]|uniref:protein wntless-like isoform X2 n=1 Tax=Portunus trituberculatus TaxID=210409 RepID=UPI001E1CC3C5|nr:protein wntless-like isoform X2 [Portunus trituberculatus]